MWYVSVYIQSEFVDTFVVNIDYIIYLVTWSFFKWTLLYFCDDCVCNIFIVQFCFLIYVTFPPAQSQMLSELFRIYSQASPYSIQISKWSSSAQAVNSVEFVLLACIKLESLILFHDPFKMSRAPLPYIWSSDDNNYEGLLHLIAP